MATDYATDKAASDASKKDAKQNEEKRARKFIQDWCGRVERGRAHDDEYRKRWASDRSWGKGDCEEGSGEKWAVKANLIGSIIEVLSSFLYARDPAVKITPSQSVGRHNVENYRKVTQTMEVIVARLWKNARLKKKAKQWVRKSMTTGTGWLKFSMQTRTEENPVVEAKINDLMGQVENIEMLQAKIDSGEDDSDSVEALQEKLEANRAALEAKREIMVAEGLVVDVLDAEDVVVASDVSSVEDYLDAPWIAIDYYKTRDEVVSKVVDWDMEEAEKKMASANVYRKRVRAGDDESAQGGKGTDHGNSMYQQTGADEKDVGAESGVGFVRVTEIWSKDDGVVYTFIDGINDCWAKEPYAPITGRRFYPIFELFAHPIDGERYPQSDVYQLKELQEEYNRTRSNFAEHRRRAIPGVIYNAEAVDQESIDSIVGAVEQEYVGIRVASPDTPVGNLFSPKAYSPVDMNLYTTLPITQEMEKISGAQDALQSSVQVEKTATEARIQEAGFGARSGSRRDHMEEVLTDAAEYTAQIVAQTFTQAEAEKFAGPNAVFTRMTPEEAMWMYETSIKAGSTGKPKAQNDKEIWTTIMPLIEKMIDRVGQARIMGEEWAAAPWIAMIEETFRRLEEPAELDKFLPQPPPPQPESQDDPAAEAELANKEADTEEKRAKVLKMVSESLGGVPAEVAMMYLLFGGQALQQNMQQQPGAPMPPAQVPPM